MPLCWETCLSPRRSVAFIVQKMEEGIGNGYYLPMQMQELLNFAWIQITPVCFMHLLGEFGGHRIAWRVVEKGLHYGKPLMEVKHGQTFQKMKGSQKESGEFQAYQFLR